MNFKKILACVAAFALSLGAFSPSIYAMKRGRCSCESFPYEDAKRFQEMYGLNLASYMGLRSNTSLFACFGSISSDMSSMMGQMREVLYSIESKPEKEAYSDIIRFATNFSGNDDICTTLNTYRCDVTLAKDQQSFYNSVFQVYSWLVQKADTLE